MAYEKQTWSNLPDKTTPISAARLSHMETQYDEAVLLVSESLSGLPLPVNVKDFGAVADGTTDDTQAVQRAFDSLPEGGGRVLFPEGEYMMYGYIDLPPGGLRVEGYGATLKKPLSGRSSVAFFAIRSHGRTGYGSGGENFFFEGFTTVGHANAGHSATFLSAHHAKNVVVRDLVSILSVAQGHAIDLNGCDGVSVVNCRFQGAAVTSTPGEAVQVDVSREGAMSVREDNPLWYDGLPSKNVSVRKCAFEEFSRGAESYPAPIAFGTHSSPDNQQLYTGLDFSYNSCHPAQDRTEGIRGVVHFVSSRGVSLVGNRFYGGQVKNPLVSFQFGINTVNSEIRNYGALVSGNFFEGGASDQVYLVVVDGLVFSNNTHSGSGPLPDTRGHAIFVSTDPTNFNISGNFIRLDPQHPDSRGIYLNAGPGTSGLYTGNFIATANPAIAYGGWGSTNSRVQWFGNIPLKGS